MMNTIIRILAIFLVIPMLLFAADAEAVIEGINGNTFNFIAKTDHISTGDGGSLLIWGYADADSIDKRAQYPGPTLIVNQGETITINLTNDLDVAVSIVFPGQENVSATGGVAGLVTKEAAAAGGSASYTFTATHAGTFTYHSGTRPELQVEMGLVGAIIVRPYGFDSQAPTAYNHPDSAYDHEYLFLMSEMDPRIHNLVEFQGVSALDNTDYLANYFPVYWFINGRTAPDTMIGSVAWLPTQPYNCLPRMHPGDKLLQRVIGGGRDLHPLHPHGNHTRVIAQDGRLLQSSPGAGADLSTEIFTFQSLPGETTDAIFTWTGKGLGWDMYGHDSGDALEPNEYAPDHGKPFPVTLPETQDLTFGGFYSGSPFLGTLGSLPPGEGGLNPNAGFTYMWHSHTEKELCNFDIFPGGLMTLLIVEPAGVPIP
jgi:FtsP/CotA-like multicopper oxidase with cupredoxin domain